MTRDTRVGSSRVELLARFARQALSVPDLDALFDAAQLMLEQVLDIDAATATRSRSAEATPEGLADDQLRVEIRGVGSVQGEICLALGDRPGLSPEDLAFVDSIALALGTAIERTQVMRVLLASQHRHAELVRQSPDPILTMSADGALWSSNHAAERLLGLQRHEPSGRLLHERILCETQLEAFEAALRTLAETRRPTLLELELRGADDQTHFVEANVGAVELDDLGCGVQVILRDLSARREAERERALMLERRAAAQRMESLGLLAGGVAHDFNNLLTIILGNSELLALMELDDEIAPLVEEIEAAGTRAAALTRQLLTLGGQRHGTPQVLELDPQLAELRELLLRLLGEDVELEVELHAAGALTLLAPSQLEQLIINLAVNARDAMPRGGKLRIRSALIQAPADRGASVEGDKVQICVEDEGVGMDAATCSRVFEPFFTTKAAAHGTGLGLAIVHGIVSRCKGSVTVDSEPGRGTRITLQLPRWEGATPSPEPGPRNPEVGARLVLIVDDDAKVRVVGRRLLEGRGYRVLEAKDAIEARSLIREQGEQIDLVLSDVIMPKISGVELMLELRELAPALPVVLMSGYPDAALERHGLDDHQLLLAKPFTAADLAEILARALGD